jgi:hypothetical protein
MTSHGPVSSDRLAMALVNLATTCQRPHCSDPKTHEFWLSEEAYERALAMRWCTGCPVIVECDAAATARHESFGVWGGRDHTKRPVNLRIQAPRAHHKPRGKEISG